MNARLRRLAPSNQHKNTGNAVGRPSSSSAAQFGKGGTLIYLACCHGNHRIHAQIKAGRTAFFQAFKAPKLACLVV